MRRVLANNIGKLMGRKYPDSPNRPLALSKAAGVSLSSVQRTLAGGTGASIDTVEAFAKVFQVQPFELLIPSTKQRS